ncbi:hypothetical protein Gotri_001230 [Gossypium trilobum]|uniref:Uncharacterized protein n=1 Tax=Gossypium trilobum TaxID=34281 RepID=A0A7J9FEB9_9ROSI|nr:hypothetical protein [Gossypium trilobum]
MWNKCKSEKSVSHCLPLTSCKVSMSERGKTMGEMLAVWVSLKENVNCVAKLSDVVGRPEKSCGNSRTQNPEKELVHQLRNPFREALFRPIHPKTQFCEIVATYFACNLTLQCKFSFLSELNVGDPSRNIIELIFQRASMDPSKSKPSWKIKRVLKVKNSIEVLKRFEDYREKVIKKANQQHERHPRSTIDGNELLLFYGTTMACCRKPKPVPELCKDPSCRACRIIHSRFDMEFTRKNGVRLSTSSEEVCDNMVSFKLKKLKRAVIVCRVIAGSIGNTIDGAREDFDSIGRIGRHSNLEYLVVPNPSAILPCFLIVFN